MRDELALLERVLPEYEQYVRDAVHVDLHQHEFDALVSFSWNIGEIPVTGGHINRGEVHRALEIIQGSITSGGKESKVLAARRRPADVADRRIDGRRYPGMKSDR